mmetsp:Transcript_28875/g.83801  ORF Transcript_28875/g.83801 Transcript_28875/m.83801 type:complete len:114 (+) Transcript_28875:137-478(+)
MTTPPFVRSYEAGIHTRSLLLLYQAVRRNAAVSRPALLHVLQARDRYSYESATSHRDASTDLSPFQLLAVNAADSNVADVFFLLRLDPSAVSAALAFNDTTGIANSQTELLFK